MRFENLKAGDLVWVVFDPFVDQDVVPALTYTVFNSEKEGNNR